MPKRGQVWLVFLGANTTPVMMTAAQATHLITAINAVSGTPPPPTAHLRRKEADPT
ncbi:MAG: hypothetical protein JO272_14580 [Pseudonocardiales bacterium]|nr:hypothetical protein [Pseudonocardiales bacterium]